MTKISDKTFKTAVKDSGGVQSVVAQRLNVERATITYFIQKNNWARELLEFEREKIIDLAENKLFVAADKGEKWAIDKILSTIGKNRGYIERQEVRSENLNINVETEVDNKMRELLKRIRDGKGRE